MTTLFTTEEKEVYKLATEIAKTEDYENPNVKDYELMELFDIQLHSIDFDNGYKAYFGIYGDKVSYITCPDGKELHFCDNGNMMLIKMINGDVILFHNDGITPREIKYSDGRVENYDIHGNKIKIESELRIKRRRIM